MKFRHQPTYTGSLPSTPNHQYKPIKTYKKSITPTQPKYTQSKHNINTIYAYIIHELNKSQLEKVSPI